MKGAPIALAELNDGVNREEGNPQDEVAHATEANIARVRPDRMVDTAKKKNEVNSSELISSAELYDLVSDFGERYVPKLDAPDLNEDEIKFLIQKKQ